MELIYAILIIIILIALLAIGYIYYYNRLQDLKINIDEAEFIIDESLREKYDTLVNTSSIVKEIIKDKKTSFKDLQEIKNEEISSFDLDRRLNEYQNLLNTLKDDYSDLNKDKDFQNNLNTIKQIDEKITAAKGFYNDYITKQNDLIRKFPSNIIAKFHNIKIKNYFDGKDLNDDNENDFKL